MRSSRAKLAVALSIMGVIVVVLIVLVLYSLGAFENGEDRSLGKIAFVRDGNVWVQELPDGTPYQLTDKGASSMPHWSPSGEWLLYFNTSEEEARLRDVWVVRADGSDERRLDSEGLTAGWLPDVPEDRLLYMTADRATVIENPDGTNRDVMYEPFVEGDELILRYPLYGFADAAREVYIELRYSDPPAPGERVRDPTHQSVWSSGPDGANAVELLPVGSLSVDDEFAFLPLGLTPDRSHLIARMNLGPDQRLHPDLQVFAVPIAGGEPRDLGLETAVGAPPAISEYGVLITAGGPQARWTNKRLALLSPDASGFTFLTEPDVAAIEPAWSPDGSLIAYVAAPDLGLESGDEALAQRRIWVVAPDGTGKRQLTRGEGFRDAAPMWSRDGRYLLFARLDAEDACAETGYDLMAYDFGDGSLDELASGLPLGGVFNEGLATGEVRACDLSPSPGVGITETFGRLDLHPVFNWWQPDRD